MNLILLEPADLRDDGTVPVRGDQARHLRQVLKVTPGQDVRIGVRDGRLGRGTVIAIAESVVELRCRFDDGVPPLPRVDLLLALPRPKVLRRLWAQLAAIGVGRIILTNAARVERNYFDTHVISPECYGPLLIEGLQQARDTRVPAVSAHRQFRPLVEDDLDALFGAGLRLMADPAGQQSITTVVRGHAPERVLLAIGPEGGWNDFERGLLAAHRFEAVGMGPRILRSDTACVALLTLVHEALRG